MPFKLVIALVLALVIASVSGWFAGASGRAEIELQQRRSDMRAEFAEARALVFDARVNLYQTNFGNAIERFQNARKVIGHLQTQLRESGLVEQAGRLEIAQAHLNDAEHASALFDSAK